MSDSLENSWSEFCKRSPEQLDMSFFDANGITFHYADDNVDRPPFLFQHGLGADLSQPLSSVSFHFVDTGKPSRLETPTF